MWLVVMVAHVLVAQLKSKEKIQIINGWIMMSIAKMVVKSNVTFEYALDSEHESTFPQEWIFHNKFNFYVVCLVYHHHHHHHATINRINIGIGIRVNNTPYHSLHKQIISNDLITNGIMQERCNNIASQF